MSNTRLNTSVVKVYICHVAIYIHSKILKITLYTVVIEKVLMMLLSDVIIMLCFILVMVLCTYVTYVHIYN